MVIDMNEKFISHGIETKILARIKSLVRQKTKIVKEKEKRNLTAANESKNWKMLVEEFLCGTA